MLEKRIEGKARELPSGTDPLHGIEHALRVGKMAACVNVRGRRRGGKAFGHFKRRGNSGAGMDMSPGAAPAYGLLLSEGLGENKAHKVSTSILGHNLPDPRDLDVIKARILRKADKLNFWK